MDKSSVSIIGTGALGSVLSKAISAAGYPVVGLYNRTEQKAREVSRSVEVKEVSRFPREDSELGQLIFITVGDQSIGQVANQLAALRATFSNHIVIHCSGNKASTILKPLQEKGAAIASFHPLQTFTAHSSPSDFEDIFIDMEGDDAAINALKTLARSIGATPMPISAKSKPYLHAAAVMASNNLVALIESATQIAATGGIDKPTARRALMPLVRKSAKNIASSETIIQALSGPVARGDASTLAAHLKLLEQNPRLKSLYQQLGRVLTALAHEQDHINSTQHEDLSVIFDTTISDNE